MFKSQLLGTKYEWVAIASCGRGSEDGKKIRCKSRTNAETSMSLWILLDGVDVPDVEEKNI